MEKTATLNVRVSPAIKQQAEEILSRLGVPMSTAIENRLQWIICPLSSRQRKRLFQSLMRHSHLFTLSLQILYLHQIFHA